MEIRDLDKSVEFPALARMLDDNRMEVSIGLSAWSSRKVSELEKEKEYPKCVEICLCKGSEDIIYEVQETEREIIIKYYWKDYEEIEEEEEG